MGWWRIDPNTGKPANASRSKLSRPPDFVLLNAVPGVDDADEAHYLGDGPGDTAWDTAREIAELLGAGVVLSAKDVRSLLMERVIPPVLSHSPADKRRRLLQVVEEFWPDIDDCYQFDWDRPAQPAERKWVCENVIEALTHKGIINDTAD